MCCDVPVKTGALAMCVQNIGQDNVCLKAKASVLWQNQTGLPGCKDLADVQTCHRRKTLYFYSQKGAMLYPTQQIVHLLLDKTKGKS